MAHRVPILGEEYREHTVQIVLRESQVGAREIDLRAPVVVERDRRSEHVLGDRLAPAREERSCDERDRLAVVSERARPAHERRAFATRLASSSRLSNPRASARGCRGPRSRRGARRLAVHEHPGGGDRGGGDAR
jgi:hypothetical protein